MQLSAILVALSLTAGFCSPVPAAEPDAVADAAANAAADAVADAVAGLVEAVQATASPHALAKRQACDSQCETDHWTFEVSNAAFNEKRDEMLKKPRSEWDGIDWINPSDGCSVPQ